MAVCSSLYFLLVSLGAMMCVHGAIITIDWTPQGVEDHRSYDNPLQVDLGDELRLNCQENYSNLFIQDEQTQYDNCNASAGAGRFDFNGFCLPNGMLTLQLVRNSQNLMNTINFVDNTVYYLSSYSSGMAAGANKPDINSGGQCEDGLKMIIIIGEVSLNDDGSLPTDGSSANSPQTAGIQPPAGKSGGGSKPPMWIYIVAAVGGVLVVAVLAGVFIAVCVKVRHKKRSQSSTLDTVSHHPSSADLLDNGPSLSDNIFTAQISEEPQKQDLSALDHSTGQAKISSNRGLNYTDVAVTFNTFGLSPKKVASSTPNIVSQFSDNPINYASVDFNVDTKSVDGFLAAPPSTFVPMSRSSDNLLKSSSKTVGYSPSPRKPKPTPPPKPS